MSGRADEIVGALDECTVEDINRPREARLAKQCRDSLGAGRWTLDGNVVTHHIEHALNPNWVGTSRDRTIDHQGDRMVFSGLAGDGKTSAVIVWRRSGTST